MNQKIKTILLSLVAVLGIFLMALPVLAQTQLPNPIGVDDPRLIIGNIIRAILGIVGSLALAVFIYGGFTWVISAGNEEKIKKGKEMIIWATFGLAVIFASYALVAFVIEAVTVGSGGQTLDTLDGGQTVETP